jgi:ABC-type dipeptide/oligopeptide/nickel transport system permease subunit
MQRIKEMAAPIKIEKSSMFIDVLKRTVRSTNAKIGAIILVVIILVCVGAPLIAPYDVNAMNVTDIFASPNKQHLFGTDGMGRDLLTRVLYGGQYSLALGFVTSLFATVMAIILGSIAGYFRGKTETVIMRGMDVLSALPSMLLCIIIATALGSGFFNTVFALAIGQIPHSVRMIRAQILSERTKEYLEAAESINCSKVSIMFRHMLPNVISPMIVCLTMGIGDNIAMVAALSYIGLGVQPPTPEWGALLSDARTHMLDYPYLIFFPGLLIALTVLAVNLVGDGLRDALDPKLRS